MAEFVKATKSRARSQGMLPTKGGNRTKVRTFEDAINSSINDKQHSFEDGYLVNQDGPPDNTLNRNRQERRAQRKADRNRITVPTVPKPHIDPPDNTPIPKPHIDPYEMVIRPSPPPPPPPPVSPPPPPPPPVSPPPPPIVNGPPPVVNKGGGGGTPPGSGAFNPIDRGKNTAATEAAPYDEDIRRAYGITGKF